MRNRSVARRFLGRFTLRWDTIIPSLRQAMPADAKNPELISTGEAARACGVSTQTIVNWIRQGRLRAATTGGGRFRVHTDSLIEFMTTSGFEVPPDLRRGPRLLYVVDDDPSWLAAVKRQLSSFGDVETFPDGYRGLVAIAARTPDLAVLDMKMPGLDGASVISALRGETATRELPIVVATSYEEEAALAKRYGATAAIVKGSAEKLREVVEHLLSSRVTRDDEGPAPTAKSRATGAR